MGLKLISVDVRKLSFELSLLEPTNEVLLLLEFIEGVVAEGLDDGFDVEADGGAAHLDIFANCDAR